MKTGIWAWTVLPLLAAACARSPVDPLDLPSLSIRVDVSGGFGSMDLEYRVAPGGAIVGVRCARLCDFEEGDTLYRMTPAQSVLLADAIAASGIGELQGLRDFGVECCDQFEYRLVFADESSERSVRGSSEALPDEIHGLVRLLEGYRLGTAPAVVAMSGSLEAWHRDPVEIVNASLEPPNLRITATYGGGCARHDLDLVAWSGWMESSPVQVGVALTHDAHGDPCQALLTRELLFDLTALREAYAKAYGPGPATLALNVAPAAASGTGRRIDWTF